MKWESQEKPPGRPLTANQLSHRDGCLSFENFLSSSDALKTCAIFATKSLPKWTCIYLIFSFAFQWSHQRPRQAAGNLCCHRELLLHPSGRSEESLLRQRQIVNLAVWERSFGRYTTSRCGQRRDSLVSWWRSCKMFTDLVLFKGHCSTCVGPRWYSDYPSLPQVRKSLQKFSLIRLKFNKFCKTRSSLHGATNSKH